MFEYKLVFLSLKFYPTCVWSRYVWMIGVRNGAIDSFMGNVQLHNNSLIPANVRFTVWSKFKKNKKNVEKQMGKLS